MLVTATIVIQIAQIRIYGAQNAETEKQFLHFLELTEAALKHLQLLFVEKQTLLHPQTPLHVVDAKEDIF